MPVSRHVRGGLAVVGALLLLAALPVAAPNANAVTVGSDGLPIVNGAGVTFGVVAHRGGAGQWPENSLEAFTGSAEAGYDGIETDLLFTVDGQPVMSHYDTLPARCTSAGLKIHLLTWSQVSKVRCANLAGQKLVPIPTFAQLAAVLKANPDVALTLDLKTYSGQSASGMRTYASRAMALLAQHDLTARTRILTYKWDAMLPTIRKSSKSIYVLAYDTSKLDLDRVRLADTLTANGYGVRLRDTSAFLARFVKSTGMDSVPWEVIGTEQRAFAIYFGGDNQPFLTDKPGELQDDLVSGAIDLNPVAIPTTTTLTKPVTVSTATYYASAPRYPLVLGPAVPTADLPMLDNVTVSITVTNGPGTGTLRVAPRSGTLGRVSAPLPKGTGTLTLTVPLGDDGKLRIDSTKTVKLTVKVLAYTRLRFA
ncbi:MAG: glycerophosphodiester phosphodiesterase family protein [Propionicimonas sp.]